MWIALLLNGPDGNVETNTTRPGDAWDLDDGWHNPRQGLPDPVTNILSFGKLKLLQDGEKAFAFLLLLQVCQNWTRRVVFVRKSPLCEDLITFPSYANCCWSFVSEKQGKKKI